MLSGTMTAGDLLVFIAYLRGLNKPMRKLAKVTSQMAKATTCGERVAIVGHSGAGKSTLIKLLLRFYDPPAGYVRIDGIDVRTVTTDSLRRQIGWVHQDTFLFGMTVAENIALGREDAGLDMIREVAARVRADEFIMALPDGYESVPGRSGLTLSGGRRQRIALARALLREGINFPVEVAGAGDNDVQRLGDIDQRCVRAR